jgi:hypothetical protein
MAFPAIWERLDDAKMDSVRFIILEGRNWGRPLTHKGLDVSQRTWNSVE